MGLMTQKIIGLWRKNPYAVYGLCPAPFESYGKNQILVGFTIFVRFTLFQLNPIRSETLTEISKSDGLIRSVYSTIYTWTLATE